MVYDVRLHNTSQLAGFAKADDLAYFLEKIGGIKYQHQPLLAPTPPGCRDISTPVAPGSCGPRWRRVAGGLILSSILRLSPKNLF